MCSAYLKLTSTNFQSIVKLTYNWRSHEDIIRYPNENFYGGSLEARGDKAITHSLLRWDGLAKKNFPIIFHGIQGRDEREESSPSFFNIAEASLVKRYVEDLMSERGCRLSM